MDTPKTSRVFGNILMTFLALLFLFPALWVVLSSLKSGTELFRYPPTIFPSSIDLSAYGKVLVENDFLTYFKNSAFVAVTATLITVAINTMAGFAFAKYNFRFSNIIFLFLISAEMLPTEILMAPTFDVISYLGLYNSLWGIIIAPAASPTGVFMIRQYFLSVPDSLLESARMDGASEWTIFTRIMVPIAKPIIATLSILSFMWRWNDFIWPLIVISEDRLYTLQLAIANLVSERAIDWGSLLSASVISMIPVLIVFLIFQKQIIRSIASTGLRDG